MAGQVWQVAAEGGYLYSDELSDYLRLAVQPLVKFRQFAAMENAIDKGLHRGDLYTWNTFSNLGTRGGDLAEDEVIPETGFTVKQNSLRITEAGNSVPYTAKLDALAKQPVIDIIDATLQDDAKKYFDVKAYREFDKTPLRVSTTNSTDSIVLDTNGVASQTNNIGLGTGHVKAISDMMKERNVPPFIMDDYIAVTHASTLRPFKNELEGLNKYTDMGIRQIYNGEVGKYEGFRFVEQSNIPKGGAADSTTFNPQMDVSDPWNNAKSSWAFFFGKETIAEAQVIPEEIRAKIPGDFGRSKGLAWYYMGGFGIIHTDATQARIFKWDSAA